MPTIYILIAIAALAVAALLVFGIGNRPASLLTPLAGLAFACIVGGLVFGQEGWLGYGLMGLGLALAVVDMLRRVRRK